MVVRPRTGYPKALRFHEKSSICNCALFCGDGPSHPSMRVLGTSWAGVKTDKYEALSFLCRKFLGLPAMHDRTDFVVFRMPNGDQLELFGPQAGNPPARFASNRVVCGFLVDDIEGARRELPRAGIELIGAPDRDSRTGYVWQHFRGPEGLVYEVTYDPRHA